MTTKEALEPTLEPCRCGRKALIERFYDGDDPQPLFVATCEICPVKTYDQFSMEEAARIWNEFVSATVNMPDGQWQHVQIKAGNPRVVAIQFETPEQATAFINSFAAVSAPIAPVVDEKDNAFIFRHGTDCVWERTTTAECEYKDTHNYCPHPEHACSCPQISGEISDNPALEETEAYLRRHGVTLEDAANAFIERLLENNLRLKQDVAALRNQAGPRRCVNCNHADTYLGRDGRCRAVVLGPAAMQGSGMAHCGCKCVFPSSAPASTVAPQQSDNYVEIPCAGCHRSTDAGLLLCPTCVDEGHAPASPVALGDEAERCSAMCADFPMYLCARSHRCVLDAGHPFDPFHGTGIHEFETHSTVVKPREIRATTPLSTLARKAAEIDIEKIIHELAHNPQVCVCKPFCVHWEAHARKVIERCFSAGSESKPAAIEATPSREDVCPHCNRLDCECSDFDVSPDMGAKD